MFSPTFPSKDDNLRMAKKTVKLGEASLRKGLRIYAVGDIHGCLDELKQMLRIIKKDRKKNPVKDYRIVFLGDYLDRGPNSRKVISKLTKLCKAKPKRIICLLGNHDEKLLSAASPQSDDWLELYFRYGGGDTLNSYGFNEKDLRDAELGKLRGRPLARRICKIVPELHWQFLESLPRSCSFDDYFFAHAGVDPKRSFDDQKAHDLCWMREPFLSWKKPLAKVVIHGHTRQSEPDIRLNRINVDTSCCYGEKLTAVVLQEDTYRFLEVQSVSKWQGSKEN